MKVIITKQLQAFIKSIGLSLDGILQKAEIPNILWKDELELSPEQYYKFLEVIGNGVSDEQILAMSDIRKMQIFLPMFFAALCSANGLDGIRRFAAYKRIIGPVFIDVSETEAEVSISLRAAVVNQTIPRMLLLSEQLLMLSLLRTGTGEELNPLHIEGPYEYGTVLKEFLGIDPLWNTDNRIVFDKQSLRKPFITQNNIMLEYLEPELMKRLKNLEDDHTFVGTVQKVLYTGIPAGNYSINETARALGVSVRALQRTLTEKGMTYKSLVQQVQQTLAENYIREGKITTDDISILVGYENTVSFMRAFKKWTGLTVMQYRKQCIHQERRE